MNSYKAITILPYEVMFDIFSYAYSLKDIAPIIAECELFDLLEMVIQKHKINSLLDFRTGLRIFKKNKILKLKYFIRKYNIPTGRDLLYRVIGSKKDNSELIKWLLDNFNHRLSIEDQEFLCSVAISSYFEDHFILLKVFYQFKCHTSTMKRFETSPKYYELIEKGWVPDKNLFINL